MTGYFTLIPYHVLAKIGYFCHGMAKSANACGKDEQPSCTMGLDSWI